MHSLMMCGYVFLIRGHGFVIHVHVQFIHCAHRFLFAPYISVIHTVLGTTYNSRAPPVSNPASIKAIAEITVNFLLKGSSFYFPSAEQGGPLFIRGTISLNVCNKCDSQMTDLKHLIGSRKRQVNGTDLWVSAWRWLTSWAGIERILSAIMDTV